MVDAPNIRSINTCFGTTDSCQDIPCFTIISKRLFYGWANQNTYGDDFHFNMMIPKMLEKGIHYAILFKNKPHIV